MSVAGVPIDQFKGAGAEFAEKLKPTLGGKEIDPYAIYGAQAAQVHARRDRRVGRHAART